MVRWYGGLGFRSGISDVSAWLAASWWVFSSGIVSPPVRFQLASLFSFVCFFSSVVGNPIRREFSPVVDLFWACARLVLFVVSQLWMYLCPGSGFPGFQVPIKKKKKKKK